MSPRTPDRRALLRGGAALALGFAGLRLMAACSSRSLPGGLGALVPDPAGLLDLPADFSYRSFSLVGEEMDDGLLVPGLHDGMAAFPGPGGHTILVRNHEGGIDEGVPKGVSAFGPGDERRERFPAEMLYDPGADGGILRGGATTLVYDTRARRLVRHHLSLAGTDYNCAGGPTPWGSWLSCEETAARVDPLHAREHGWVFEVPASAAGPVAPVPLRAMGRFRHEAAAIDARSGVVYLTEDRPDSLLYRFLPARPGELAAGGRLQALVVRGMPGLLTGNKPDMPSVSMGEPLATRWIDMEETDSPLDDLRARGAADGAARFERGEGLWATPGAVFMACTTGGPKSHGQLWRYRPSASEGAPGEDADCGQLELWIEPRDPAVLDRCDNIAAAPWGDILVCEDGPESNRVLGVTPGGEVYPIAHNAAGPGEFAGCCFSPDGTTLFANSQKRGVTFAIVGPWERARA